MPTLLASQLEANRIIVRTRPSLRSSPRALGRSLCVAESKPAGSIDQIDNSSEGGGAAPGSVAEKGSSPGSTTTVIAIASSVTIAAIAAVLLSAFFCWGRKREHEEISQ